MALANNGVDEQLRVVGSQGKRPILRNVTQGEIEAFRNQVQVIDLIDCEDTNRIVATIEQLAATDPPTQPEARDCGAVCSTVRAPQRHVRRSWSPT